MNADVTTTARDRARLIREGLAAVWDLLTAAYAAEDWKTLGYSSWEAYCIGEFQGRIPRLAKSERGGVVQELADHGMPIKAIAAATGIARNTVRKDLRTDEEQPEGGQNDPSEEPPSMSRTEWADAAMAELRERFGELLGSVAALREELPKMRAIRRQYPEMGEELREAFALVEHEDGTVITDDEHRAALVHLALTGETDRDEFYSYLRNNRPTA